LKQYFDRTSPSPASNGTKTPEKASEHISDTKQSPSSSPAASGSPPAPRESSSGRASAIKPAIAFSPGKPDSPRWVPFSSPIDTSRAGKFSPLVRGLMKFLSGLKLCKAELVAGTLPVVSSLSRKLLTLARWAPWSTLGALLTHLVLGWTHFPVEQALCSGLCCKYSGAQEGRRDDPS